MRRRRQTHNIIEKAQGDILPKRKIRRRLKTMADIRRYLSGLINDCRNAEIDAALAGRLAYMLNILRGVISDDSLEQRICALEDVIQKDSRR